MKRVVAAWLAVLMLAQGACATAKIVRADAVDVEGKIAGGDTDNVYVVDGEERTFAVPRRNIRDVDHPGNVWMAGSAPLLGVAGILTIMATTDCNGEECGILQAFALVGALLYGGAGLAGFTIGYSQWSRSVANLDPAVGPPPWLRGHPASGPAPIPAPAASTVPPLAAPVDSPPAPRH